MEIFNSKGLQGGSSIAFPSDSRKQIIGTDPDDESFGEELGELADLTVNNEADQNNYDVSIEKQMFSDTPLVCREIPVSMIVRRNYSIGCRNLNL